MALINRFKISMLDVFPHGAYLVSEVEAVRDFDKSSPGRPVQAVDLRKEALTLPRTGWGELYLSTSAPAAGRAWSQAGHAGSRVSSSTARSTRSGSCRARRS